MKLRDILIVSVTGVLVLGILLAGCTRSSPTSSVPTSGTTQPITTRWPPGIETVVLSTETGVCVVDADGIRWAREAPVSETSTTVTLRGPQIVSGLDGLAVSSNNDYLAYIEEGREIVVRSLTDGNVVQRCAVESAGHTSLRSISPDGILAALVTVDPQLEAEKRGDEVPWTVTVVDLTTGAATVEDTLADFVQQRIQDPARGRCGLATLDWLPEYKLLVGLSGDPYETYVYDPVADHLVLIPDLQYVWSFTPGGLVLGSATETGEAVVWNSRDGSSEPVILDPAWPNAGHGSLNADGTALVLTVASSADWESRHGWQVFVRAGAEWRPAGPVAEVDWMNQAPSLLSGDGTTAWAVVYQSTGDNKTVLLSHDFTTGAWEEWFRSEDMLVDWGSFYFVSIALKD